MKNNLDEFIYQEFLKKDIKQLECYGQYLVACQKRDEFFSKLSLKLLTEFNSLYEIYNNYIAERNKALVRYVLEFVSKIFN